MKEHYGPYHYGNAKTYDDNNKYPAMWGNFDSKWAYFKSGNGQADADTNGIIKEGTDNASEKEGLIWEQENGNEGSMSGSSQGDKDTQFKQAHWWYNYGTGPTASDWVNPEYYNLLFGKNDSHFDVYYWLACRYVYLYGSVCDFGLQRVRANSNVCNVTGSTLYKSNRRPGYV